MFHFLRRGGRPAAREVDRAAGQPMRGSAAARSSSFVRA